MKKAYALHHHHHIIEYIVQASGHVPSMSQRSDISVYLAVHCAPLSSQRHLRSAERNLLHVPRHRLDTYGRPRASVIAGPSDWNSFPDPVRNPNSTEAAFRRLLKTFSFARY